jgi:adenylylsulfate kinase
VTTFLYPTNSAARRSDLSRIEDALRQVHGFLSRLDWQSVKVTRGGSDPTTSLDAQIDRMLRELLPRGDEGWLSEETPDNRERLNQERVWVVDPLDGTSEFLAGLPEWSVSIALVECGRAVAGGVLNPSTGEMFSGADGIGITASGAGECAGPELLELQKRLLVSRREHSEGRWRHFSASHLTVVPTGSVAYRLAQVAAGRAAATCTLGPRHQWDVAAGVALVSAAGGTVHMFNGGAACFNLQTTLVGGLCAYTRSEAAHRTIKSEDSPVKRGATIWFTGLSSAGKTTISHAVCGLLRARGHRVELLDGDVVRTGLCRDLGFTHAERNENIRRIGFVADLLTRNGVIAIVSAISPYRATRDEMRSRIGDFIEVYVNAPLATCEARDVKGLYRKARSGLLPQFTGLDDPYEPPLAPEIECRTDSEDLSQSVDRVMQYLDDHLSHRLCMARSSQNLFHADS